MEGYEESEASMEKTAQLLEEVIMLILRRSEEINRLKKEYISCHQDYHRISLMPNESPTSPQAARLSERALILQYIPEAPPRIIRSKKKAAI